MKVIKILSVALVSMLVACTSNRPASLEGFTASEIDSVSTAIGTLLGYNIAGGNFDGVDMDKVVKAFKAAAACNQGDINQEEAMKLSQAVQNFLQKKDMLRGQKNSKEGEAFLAENKTKEGVMTTESGLQYKIMEQGNEKCAVSDKDTVQVHYTGTLIDGTEFDASDKAGNPVTFPLNRVIKGWTEGMKLVGEGGKIRLFVPSELAYGERGAGQHIGPNATLIFDVELIKVSPFQEEPAAKGLPKDKK